MNNGKLGIPPCVRHLALQTMSLDLASPPTEAARLARLQALQVLDSAPEALFDALTRLAAQHLGVPISLVSLIDADRQWFKASEGLNGVTQTPRDHAFCARAIEQDTLMEVADATADPRFANNPLVQGDPHIRFYAGAPITLSPGVRLGTLCVIDRQPRQLSATQRRFLSDLAEVAAEAFRMKEQALLARQAHESELQAREASYQAIVEDQSELISLARPDGTLLFVNGAYGRHYGVTAAQAVGRSVYDFVDERDRMAVRQHLAAVCDQGGVFRTENRTRSASGQGHWMAWTNRRLVDAQGRVSAIHSVGFDITDYKATQAALQESQAQLRTVYERTPAMLCSLDAQGRLLTVSDSWLDKLGYTRAEVIGRRAADFLAHDGHDRMRRTALVRYLSTGQCQNLEQQLLRKDGSRLDVRLSAVLERDAQGRHLRSTAIVEDVTERHAVEAELRAQRERLAQATQANEIGIWELTLPEARLVWSDEMFRIFGCAHDEFRGQVADWERCLHPDDVAMARQHLSDALAGRHPLDFDFRVRHPNGQVRYVYARATIFRDAQGQPLRVLGTNYDVTERKRMERELAEKHELLRVTLHSIGDAVITTDAQGRVQWLNPVAERMTGWATEAARGQHIDTVFRIVDEHSRQTAPCPVSRCLQGLGQSPAGTHTLLLSTDGREHGIEDSAAPILDDAGTVLGAVLVFHDVTEQRRMGHEMRFRATHDELTGLCNRAEFEQRLQRALDHSHRDGSSHAMMYIDLDQFKLVNDACGHAMGDQLLCQVTQLLQARVRASDTLARLGGDEFGVILEHCSVEQAQSVAQSICDAMDDFRFVHEGRRFRVGTSIGLVPIDSRWHSLARVLQAADTACYAAKEAGRNRVHAWFDTDQALQARKGEMQWASRIEQALDDDRFVLFAQRITPLRPPAPGQRPPGLHAEVLLRLRDPDGSLVPPGAFLPAAERFHLASRIDRWVVRRVFAWMKAQPEAMAGVDLLSVNLSGQSIGDRAFHRFVAEQLAGTQLNARKLCLEVTETAAITNLVEATAFITEMRQLGVRVALDDFGAGSSSFGYLKRLTVDYLKVDGQFIKTLTANALDQAAVRCFHDVAQVLGIQTIAEFVEDEATAAALRHIGIDHAQGYLLHRPEPIEAALALPLPQRLCNG